VKKFEYVYFTIYHYYSRQSYFADSLVVRLKSMYLIALSLGGWILLFQMLFLRFIRNAWFSSHPGAMLYALGVYGAATFILHRIFIKNELDQKIFEKYVHSYHERQNKRRDLVLAFLVAAAPYLIMLGVKVFFPR
jgi:hypothetical protein